MLPISASASNLLAHPARRRPRSASKWLRPEVLGLLMLAAFGLIALSVFYSVQPASAATEGTSSLRRASRMLVRSDRANLRTLVIYVYSGSDPEYEQNLRYFLRVGIKVGLHFQRLKGCAGCSRSSAGRRGVAASVSIDSRLQQHSRTHRLQGA